MAATAREGGVSVEYTKIEINCLKCHHRNPENGNCVAVGGFCTAVPAAYCPLIPELLARCTRLEEAREHAEKERDAAISDLEKGGAKALPSEVERDEGEMIMKRLTSKKTWESASKDLANEMGYSHIWKRLAAIEDILGDEYDLADLRELLEVCKGKTPDHVEGVFEEWSHYLKFSAERNAIEGALDFIYQDGEVDYERLRELVEADRDGRCHITP